MQESSSSFGRPIPHIPLESSENLRSLSLENVQVHKHHLFIYLTFVPQRFLE